MVDIDEVDYHAMWEYVKEQYKLIELKQCQLSSMEREHIKRLYHAGIAGGYKDAVQTTESRDAEVPVEAERA